MLLLAMLAGCAPEAGPGRDLGGTAARGDDEGAAVPARPLAARAGDLFASLPDELTGSALPPPRFPADLGSHADMPFESRSWYILLSAPDGSVRALRQRFDRVALRTDAERGPVAMSGEPAAPVGMSGQADVSAWRFDALMQASGSRALIGAGSAAATGVVLDETAGSLASGWRQGQRVALGLAHSGLQGAASEATPRTSFGVLGHRLAFRPATQGCAGRYRLSGPDTGAIEIVQSRCPAGDVAGALVRAGTGAMPATSDDGARGIAWQRHVWGAVPDAGQGAVRFDVATLTLRGLGTLELVRSRRRSGRGTPVVTARLLDGAQWRPVEGVTWPLDGEAAVQRVRIASLGIDVTLSRLALPGEPGPLPDPVAWRGVLFAQGTHAGAGFAELAATGADADAR